MCGMYSVVLQMSGKNIQSVVTKRERNQSGLWQSENTLWKK